jgi:hypothetical protein
MTDLEIRLTVLEERVARLHLDGAQTRVLAATVDRDAAAVRVEQRQYTAAVQNLGAGIEQLTSVATHLAAGLDRHEDMLTALARGQDRLTAGQGAHTEILTQHTETLAHHGQLLTEILRRLPGPDHQA